MKCITTKSARRSFRPSSTARVLPGIPLFALVGVGVVGPRSGVSGGWAAGRRCRRGPMPGRNLGSMSPFPRESKPETLMSASELNTRIRELWADGALPEDRRPEYEALVVEWAAAAHEDVRPAA